MILGLTGSIGSGKSTVSAMLADCGATLVCADKLAHEVVGPRSEALGEIAAAFGEQVIRPNGSLDRQVLAAIVFPDPDQRRRLEEIIHPRVRRMVLDLLNRHSDVALLVLDIPLLFESGYDERCDVTVSVTISEPARLERLRASRGMSAEQVAARLAAQLPQEEKNRRATFLVDNSGSLHQTCLQVAALLKTLFPENLPAGLRLPRCEDPQNTQLN